MSKRKETIESQKPTKGWVVMSSYNMYEQKGYYSIYDLDKCSFVIKKKLFLDVNTSENVIGYLGMSEASFIADYNNYNGPIYTANKYSLLWTRKSRCNTKLPDPKIMNYVTKAEGSIKNLPKNQLLLWQPYWGKSKDVIDPDAPENGDGILFNFEDLPEEINE